ncbi:myc target protein 1 homolog [Takifugu rubripes]|uniref:Myc target 1a n=1 Tax=Takifugu rubripes TaxID=31033 RepID=H2VBA7_TAKRU|nr:myc target protein 1 homolog [Takifugu rubripes]
MAENNTSPLLETLQSFDAVPLIVAFCVSMAVGLILGAVANVILTWMYRRKTGSARITRCPPHRSRTWWNLPGFNRSRSYDCHSNNSLVSAALMSYRQTSSPDHYEANLKSSFRGSTFHPLLQDSQFTREADEGSQTCLSPTPTTSTGLVQTGTDCAANPPTLVSFWGNNNLRGFPNQSLLPASESILRAYDETCI